MPPPLTIEQILAWADAHRARTGRWPTATSGRVRGCRHERWDYLNHALRYGLRGLPGGTTLARLLAARRGARNKTNLPDLTLRRILSWARAHHARTGQWPTRDCGAVAEAPGETWMGIHRALRDGHRGLSGGCSLAQLLAARLGARNHMALPRLTLRQILAWADAHHARTGQWPRRDSGPIADAPGETWAAVDAALWAGSRRLQGGSSLYLLLKKRRRIPGPRPRVRVRKVRCGATKPVTRIELPDELLARFRSGELGADDLARLCRVAPATAARELRRAGVGPRPRGRPPGGRPAWHTEVVRRYRRGQSLREVAAALGLTKPRVRAVLRRYGVPLRPRGRGQVLRGIAREDWERLGRRVRSLRRAARLTREQVAGRGGPAVETLRRVEAGQASPTRATIRRLARALRVRMEDLLPAERHQS